MGEILQLAIKLSTIIAEENTKKTISYDETNNN